MHQLLKNIDHLIEAPNGIDKLRQTVLQLAVQGKLTSEWRASILRSHPELVEGSIKSVTLSDGSIYEPASELLKIIIAEKEKLIADGKLKKQPELPPIKDEEKPFELPIGWVWGRIGDLYELKTGATPSTSTKSFFGGKIKWLVSGDIHKGEILDCEGRITEEGLKNSNCKILPVNSVLIALNGQGKTRATVAILRTEAACNQSLVAMVPIGQYITPEYLFLNLKGRYYEIRDITGQKQRRGLNMGLVGSLVFSIPPLAEQHRIVEKVNDLMKLIDELEKKKETRDRKKITLNNSSIDKLLRSKTEEEQKQNWQTINSNFNTLYSEKENVVKLKQTILQLAVQGKLVEQNPNNEPSSELIQKIKAEKEKLIAEGKIKKQKELPPIKDDEKPFVLPKGWEWVRLGEITNYGNNLKTDGKGIDKYTWVLDLEDIEKTSSRLLKKVRYHEKQFLSSKTIFNKGDVIYGKLRPYLDKVLVADEDGVCTTEMIPIKGYFDIDPFFLRWILKSPYFIEYANNSTHGMNLPRLGTDKARLATIPLCILAEQQRIVEKVNELMSLCNKLEQNLTHQTQEQEKLVNAVVSKIQ